MYDAEDHVSFAFTLDMSEIFVKLNGFTVEVHRFLFCFLRTAGAHSCSTASRFTLDLDLDWMGWFAWIWVWIGWGGSLGFFCGS